jgi:small subunit ribosomal protein S17
MSETAKGKIKVGIVTSDKMDKTRVIKTESVKKHAVYGKYLKTSSKYYAHDPENKSKAGDKVAIKESIPISKKKRWIVAEIIEKVK